MNTKHVTALLGFALLFACQAAPASAQHRIKDLCRVKGQESTMLRGVGLVVGLNGSGDPNLTATRQAVARALVNSGIELPVDAFGREDLADFQNVANAALVFVTARVPEEGARQGTLLDCQVHTFGNANSLSGGTLMETPLTGGLATGNAGGLPVYAIANGKIETNPRDVVTTGVIPSGCQLSNDFNNKFFYFEDEATMNEVAPLPEGTRRSRRMFVDLVLKRTHASWELAADIAFEINQSGQLLGLENAGDDFESEEIARPLDQVTIQVEVPDFHQRDPVSFISNLENIAVVSTERAIVVINEVTGTIVVGREVSFRAMAITSGDFSIDAGPFRELNLEQAGQVEAVQERKLADLVSALNSLQTPSETMVDIIKQLHEAGAIIGEVKFN